MSIPVDTTVSAYILTRWIGSGADKGNARRPDLDAATGLLAWHDVAGTPANRLPPTPNAVVLHVTVTDNAALAALDALPGAIVLAKADDATLDTVITTAQRNAIGTRLQAAGLPAAKVGQLVPAGATWRQAVEALRPYTRNL